VGIGESPSSADRIRRGENAYGSRLQEVGASIRQTFEPVIMTHLYPRSEISIHVSVLSADGG
jgi:exosome complex component RRP41